MSPRRRRRGPPRCKDCNALVVFFRSARTGAWMPFDPRPLSGRDHPGSVGRLWVIENAATAWPLRELVEDLMVRREISQAEADDEAHDMPWYQTHICTRPTTTDSPEEP